MGNMLQLNDSPPWNNFKILFCSLFGPKKNTSQNTPSLYRLGRLGVPNFIKYFTAAQITPLISLYTSQQAPLWADLDTFCCSLISPRSLPWLPTKSRPASMSPLMQYTLNIWYTTKYISKLFLPHLSLLPLLDNPFSLRIKSPSDFHRWHFH